MTTPYVPYKHKTTLSTSTASSTQSRGTTPTPTASINTGFVRPPADPTPLRAPQARAAIPMGWSTSGPNSIGGGSGSGPGRVSSPSTTFGSPNGSYGRPTPPVTPNPPAMNLPFQSLSPGNSPFPPSTPRVGSPTTVSRGGGVKKAAGQGGNGTRGKGVYRSGFQPMGVRRDRTEEFMGRRKVGGEGKKLEEGRLGRRLDKLVSLHFPPPEPAAPAPPTGRTSALASLSGFGESLRGKSAKELWSSFGGGKSEEEAAEQAIVKWQDDSDATRCPICMAAFGLKTRRHHCRLCGRVVCFLPPTAPLPPPSTSSDAPPTTIPAPSRKERCSSFFTCEYEGIADGGEKKPIGVIIELAEPEPDSSLGGVVLDATSVKMGKDDRKKVRVCRECLSVVLRQQNKTLPVRTPTWIKLYEVLVQLEMEIEESLPEFQDLVLSVQNPSLVSPSAHPSALAAQTLRKRLLTNLASYDTISKRIRDLPLSDSGVPGGSQDRLQRAVAQRGVLFLTEKLGLLRSLGNVDEEKEREKARKKEKKESVRSLASLMGKESPGGPAVSGQLAVLLEQEALVKGYVEDANARRQFEDAQSLSASLTELRLEIARVRLSS